MSDGKHAVGLKGFPTPNTAASIAGYLLFLFDDTEYAQWILGALETLVYDYNFYESGDLSPSGAAEMFRGIIQDAPYNLKTCANPDGGKIFRVNAAGHVQELGDGNDWQDPSGDATIPPVPEREGGTEADQICLASKNAANVLQLLYEDLTDSFNEGLDEAEAATALTLTLVSLIGAEFAPITFALVTFFSIVFSVLYGILEFVGADLWDGDFTDNLVCILKGCAANDAGVVTFDWECFNNALAAQTNVFSLTFDQLRLFGQLEYILLVIGGVDALNAAGATTAITDDECPCGWCYQPVIQDGSGHGLTYTFLLSFGHITSNGLESVASGTSQVLAVEISWAATANMDEFYFEYFTSAAANGGSRQWQLRNGATVIRSGALGTGAGGNSLHQTGLLGATCTTLKINLDINLGSHTPNWVSLLRFSGFGSSPFDIDNCS